MFQKFYEFNVSSMFYKMRENFPSMRVSVRMYQIACVSRRIRETWKVWGTVCGLVQGVLYQLSYCINSNRTLYPVLAPAVSRHWKQVTLELSNHSLKRRESRGNQWRLGKKHWLILYSHQNINHRKNDAGHLLFTDNIAEKWLTSLLR